MGPLDLAIHVLSFAAPALAVAVLVAGAARFLLPSQAKAVWWWAQSAINSAVGVLVLAGGLWFSGVDGKMATYAAMLAAIASAQWMGSRAWRG